MRVIDPPTFEPVTLTDVKSQLGILASDTAQNAAITRRITEARQWAEDYMQRAISPQTQEIRLNDFPHNLHAYDNVTPLPFPNLLSVKSVKYIEPAAGVETTVDPAEYTVDTYGRRGSVRPVYGSFWPYARTEPNAVRIQYRCGYDVRALAAPKTVTAATNAVPGVFTCAGHGYTDGTLIKMVAAGMTEVDGNVYRVINKTTDTFQLADLANTSGIATNTYGVFTAGTVQAVESTMPDLMKEGLLLLIGHWMNNQPQGENGVVISRVPFAVRDIFDKFSDVEYV